MEKQIITDTLWKELEEKSKNMFFWVKFLIGEDEIIIDKKISKDKVYFPGYVMIEANLVGEIPHMLRDITNVIGFLGETKGGDPVPMRQSEINRILGTVDELSEQPEEINIPYVVGESVKVTDGPFNGFTGVIEEVNNDKKRVKVIVKVFGRQTPLELSFMQVEKE